MAVYETDKSSRNAASVSWGQNRGVVTDFVTIAMTTAMIDNANDDVGLFYVPAGAVILAAGLGATDMDSNGAPTLSIDVGDASVESRIFAASTVGQAGTVSFAMARTAILYQYTTRTQIRAYINTTSATPVAGTLYFWLKYVVDPGYSTTALVAV